MNQHHSEDMTGAKGKPGCAPSGLLGIWYLLMAGYIIVLIGLLTILAMLHKEICKYEKPRRQSDQNPSQAKKPACELNERVCLPLQILRRFRLLFCNHKLNLRHQWALISVAIRRTSHRIQISKVLPNCTFGGSVHQSKNAKMPNSINVPKSGAKANVVSSASWA